MIVIISLRVSLWIVRILEDINIHNFYDNISSFVLNMLNFKLCYLQWRSPKPTISPFISIKRKQISLTRDCYKNVGAFSKHALSFLSAPSEEVCSEKETWNKIYQEKMHVNWEQIVGGANGARCIITLRRRRGTNDAKLFRYDTCAATQTIWMKL